MKLEGIKFSFVYCFIIESFISIPKCSFISFVKNEKFFFIENNLLNLNNFLKNENRLLTLIYIIIPKI